MRVPLLIQVTLGVLVSRPSGLASWSASGVTALQCDSKSEVKSKMGPHGRWGQGRLLPTRRLSRTVILKPKRS